MRVLLPTNLEPLIFAFKMESESEGTEPVSDTDGSCSSSVEDTTSTDDYVSMKRPRYACTFRPGTNTFEWAKVSKKGPRMPFALAMSALHMVAGKI